LLLLLLLLALLISKRKAVESKIATLPATTNKTCYTDTIFRSMPTGEQNVGGVIDRKLYRLQQYILRISDFCLILSLCYSYSCWIEMQKGTSGSCVFLVVLGSVWALVGTSQQGNWHNSAITSTLRH
jgi:hypothetical protein